MGQLSLILNHLSKMQNRSRSSSLLTSHSSLQTHPKLQNLSQFDSSRKEPKRLKPSSDFYTTSSSLHPSLSPCPPPFKFSIATPNSNPSHLKSQSPNFLLRVSNCFLCPSNPIFPLPETQPQAQPYSSLSFFLSLSCKLLLTVTSAAQDNLTPPPSGHPEPPKAVEKPRTCSRKVKRESEASSCSFSENLCF